MIIVITICFCRRACAPQQTVVLEFFTIKAQSTSAYQRLPAYFSDDGSFHFYLFILILFLQH